MSSLSKHVYKIIFCAIVLFSNAIPLRISATTATTLNSLSEIALYSQQAYIYNIESETAIYQKNSNEKTSPASLTKLVTALVVREYISDHNLTQTVTITREMLEGLREAQATVNGLQENDVVSIYDLLKGMLIQSGADASNALASHIESITGQSFISLMNETANELGLNNTQFANAHGLDDENQYSTPQDMAVIGRAFMSDALLSKIMSTYLDEMTIEGSNPRTISVKGSFIVMNEESDMHSPEVIWGKIGYTKDAQRCVVAYLHHNGMSFIVVLMKAPIPLIQYHHATNHDIKTLSTILFENYKILDYQIKEDFALTRPLTHSKNINSIQLELAHASKLFVSFWMTEKDIELTFHIPEEIIAPVTKNEPLGWISFKAEGKELTSIPVISIYNYESIYDNSIISNIQIVLNRYWPFLLIILLCYQLYLNQRSSKLKLNTRRRRAFANYYDKPQVK